MAKFNWKPLLDIDGLDASDRNVIRYILTMLAINPEKPGRPAGNRNNLTAKNVYLKNGETWGDRKSSFVPSAKIQNMSKNNFNRFLTKVKEQPPQGGGVAKTAGRFVRSLATVATGGSLVGSSSEGGANFPNEPAARAAQQPINPNLLTGPNDPRLVELRRQFGEGTEIPGRNAATFLALSGIGGAAVAAGKAAGAAARAAGASGAGKAVREGAAKAASRAAAGVQTKVVPTSGEKTVEALGKVLGHWK